MSRKWADEREKEEGEQAKSPEPSTFYRLLKQLAEEHDREVANTRCQSEGDSAPIPATKTESNAHNRSLRTASRETHESRQFISAAHSMLNIHVEAIQNRGHEPVMPMKNSIKLHQDWLIEERRISENFTATLPRLNIKDSSKTVMIEQPPDVLKRCDVRTAAWVQMTWDTLGAFCIAFDLIWIPVQIGFEAVASSVIETLEWFVRVFWTLDLIVRFSRLVRRDEGMPERSCFWRKRCQGLRWLCMDFLIVVADWVPLLVAEDAASTEAFGLLRIGKIPRMLRILRILRLARIVKLEDLLLALRDQFLVSSESMSLTLNMLKNMILILVCCHLSACVWFYIGNGNTEQNWVFAHNLYGPEVPLLDKYLYSFHWVAAQWTPASMEVFPHSIVERYFNVVLLVCGVMTFSTFMGAITASLTRLRSLSGFELSQFFLLRRYLHENSISRSLTVRISRYIDLALEMHRKRIHQDDVHYLKLLSGPLKIDLQKEIYLPHLCRLPFFADYNAWDPDAMNQLCFCACARTSVPKGDILFSLGGESRRMYCAVTGTLIYQRRRGLRLTRRATCPRKLARVGPSVWCCEASLWVRWHHYGSMCALVESEVVEVDAQKFRDVTLSRSSVLSMSVAYAKNFAKEMCDVHGYAWDVPDGLLYPESAGEVLGTVSWWQREVVDAEMKEAKWWATIDDDRTSEFDYTEDLDDDDDVDVLSRIDESNQQTVPRDESKSMESTPQHCEPDLVRKSGPTPGAFSL